LNATVNNSVEVNSSYVTEVGSKLDSMKLKIKYKHKDKDGIKKEGKVEVSVEGKIKGLEKVEKKNLNEPQWYFATLWIPSSIATMTVLTIVFKRKLGYKVKI